MADPYARLQVEEPPIAPNLKSAAAIIGSARLGGPPSA
jgi:hypothetical protein